VALKQEQRKRILISALVGAIASMPAVAILTMDKYPRMLGFLDRLPEWVNSAFQIAVGILVMPGMVLGMIFGQGVHDPSVPGMAVGSFVFYYCAVY
jgi:mannose/fructose/N-acetylgalactosamine-specific phosphotransferase system component IIC